MRVPRKPRLRFVDGIPEQRLLRQRYSKQMSYYSERERTIWELGFDYGVDDEGAEDGDLAPFMGGDDA